VWAPGCTRSDATSAAERIFSVASRFDRWSFSRSTVETGTPAPQ